MRFSLSRVLFVAMSFGTACASDPSSAEDQGPTAAPESSSTSPTVGDGSNAPLGGVGTDQTGGPSGVALPGDPTSAGSAGPGTNPAASPGSPGAVMSTGPDGPVAPGTSGEPSSPSAGNPTDGPTAPVLPFEAASNFAVIRKVKRVLTGLSPTDEEAMGGTDPSRLQALIDDWMKTPEFEARMLTFFSNAFQQSSLAQLDFEFQLRKRPGAFDLSYNIFGDSAFPLLFQNLKESFARTCLQLISEGRPFSEVLTTDRFMLTTALKSLYMQIEMPYDIHDWSFKFNHGERPPIEDTLNPDSPNYMVWGYEAPTTTTADRVFKPGEICAGDTSKISEWPGNTLLFQVLLGSIPRDSTNNSLGITDLGCMEHPAKPYFTPDDLSDWQMVQIVNSGTPLASYDLPALRASGGTLSSKLPRIGFFTTPAFMAVWNTNDSNQHRVTANQALLVALGEGFTSLDSAIATPPDLTAVDGQHAVENSACYGCHQSLDPMRQFWNNAYSYSDQVAGRAGAPASFGFANVQQNGETLADFGGFLGQVSDEQVSGDALNRFALELTQKLCFLANSSRCESTDPEMRRVAHAFEDSSYDFHALVRELFSSSLVTYATSTQTADTVGTTISIARRDQLCQSLSHRLGRADLCEIEMPTPTNVTTAMNRLAGALPADGFSRGSQYPVTPPDPNLFYRAASELVCEAIAVKVVDSDDPVYTSDASDDALLDMVSTVMGLVPSEPKYQPALEILQQHLSAAQDGGASATDALRSTFAAACESPVTLAVGL